MTNKIESEKLVVKQIFTKWFRIPEYQRPYVWERDQVWELLEDIMEARNSNPFSEYFLGSMVLKKTTKKEGNLVYDEYDLLDGQQRLTTLYLITAVIRDLTKSNIPRLKACQESIYQMANPDDNIPERPRIIFDIRDKVREFTNKYIKTEGGTQDFLNLNLIINSKEEDISIRQMAKAILYINEFFKNNKIDDFFPYLRSNVLMIYVSAEDLEDAFRLFTVLNNRGIKLRNSDILKAENLGKITDTNIRTECAKKWEETENYFLEGFDSFLSHLRTILVKQKAHSSLLKEFEDNIYNPSSYDRTTKETKSLPPLLTKGKETFDFVIKYKKYHEQLFENKIFQNSFELQNYLNMMRVGFESDFWIAPLLKYFDKYKTENIIPFVKSLDNKFANDWLLGFSPTTRIENVNTIIQTIDEAITTDQILEHKCLNIDKKQLQNILKEDIYGKRGARYLMLKLDLLYHGHTTKFEHPDQISIEHILPQQPQKDSQWCKEFNEEERKLWTNKIGNLVLISRRKNSMQGNKDYFEKRDKYFKNNIELFSNSIRVFNEYNHWTKLDLEKNQEVVTMKLFNSFNP